MDRGIGMAGKISKTSYSIPGGSVKQLQYNDTGLFGGAAQLYWNKATNCLGLGRTPTASRLAVAFGIGEAPVFEMVTADTNVNRTGLVLKHKTTGDMINGLGVNLLFGLEDATSGSTTIAQVKATRDGADNEGRLDFAAGTNGSEKFLTIRSDGRTGVAGVSTPPVELTVGPITKQNTCRINGVSTANMAPVLSLFRHANAEWALSVHGDKFLIGTDPASYTDANLSSSAKFAIDASGHIGMGTTSPATSALLELSSTTGVLLLSRMTTTQKNNLTPVNGMQVYDLTLEKFQKREGGAWVGDGGGTPAGSDTQVQFNDGGSFGANAGLYYDKTKQKLTVGEHWDAGYPFNSFEAAIEGISQNGEWGVLGASRSSDDPVGNTMKCLGLYGFVCVDSDTSGYGIYTEARKWVSTPDNGVSGAEFVILNRVNVQCDVTPYINYPQPTVGVAITSGTNYDVPYVTDYPASCALYIDYVNSSFRRGIVISSASLMDHGGGKYIAMIMGSGARIAWHNDNNCIMGTATTIDTLIANNIITQHAATKFKVNQNIQLPNNKHLTGLTTGSVVKNIIGINASNAVEIATGVIGLVTIGYNGTLSDGVMIRVNGANKIIHTGIADSGGTGYRALIVTN
jgi:hypothetical protein